MQIASDQHIYVLFRRNVVFSTDTIIMTILYKCIRSHGQHHMPKASYLQKGSPFKAAFRKSYGRYNDLSFLYTLSAGFFIYLIKHDSRYGVFISKHVILIFPFKYERYCT